MHAMIYFHLYYIRRGTEHAIRYSELVEGNATEREIQEHLTGGETTTMTLRIPGNLHESAKEAAALRGMSLSAFVRSCMIRELGKRS